MLLFLCAKASTSTTNKRDDTGRCVTHIACLQGDGDWSSLFRYVDYTTFTRRTRGRSLGTFLTTMFFRKSGSGGQNCTVNFPRSALCHGNRSFIPELGVLPRITSRVLSIAYRDICRCTMWTNSSCYRGNVLKGVLSVDREVFSEVSGGGCCQLSEPKSPRFKPKQADCCSAKPCILLPKNQVRFSLQSSALLTGTFFVVFPVHPGKLMDIT